ncbi:MAG: rod shape-determining protein MreD [Hyphomonadaceae bacterium]|nr:rod shape-determining protein MreD [Clostridia bacterium]
MRIFITAVLVLFAFVFQTSLLDVIQIGNIRPNLVVMVIIQIALLRGYYEGGIVGLCAGIVMDIMTGRIFGAFALLCMLIGLLSGGFHHRIFKENFLSAMMFTFVFINVYEVLFYIFQYFVWGQHQFSYAFMQYVLPTAIYSTVISAPIYMLLYRINEWLLARENDYF